MMQMNSRLSNDLDPLQLAYSANRATMGAIMLASTLRWASWTTGTHMPCCHSLTTGRHPLQTHHQAQGLALQLGLQVPHRYDWLHQHLFTNPSTQKRLKAVC